MKTTNMLTRKMKCLIIDDEPLAREHIKEMAEQIEFLEVEATFSTALEANKAIVEGKTDLLFLDINLPYFSGNNKTNLLINSLINKYQYQTYSSNKCLFIATTSFRTTFY